MSWPLLPLLCTLIICAGLAADKVLHDREHNRIRKWLRRLWDRLDKTQVPAIPTFVAERTLALGASIFGKRFWSLRAIGLTSVLSVSITLTAILLAAVSLDERWAIAELLSYSISPGGWRLLLINLVFDTLTILITARVLTVVQNTRPICAIALLVLDSCVAFALAFACIYSLILSIIFIRPDFGALDLSITLSISLDILIANPFTPQELTQDPEYRPFQYSAFTTFAPTLAYTSLMIAAIIAKPIISAIRRIALYVLQPTWDPAKDTVFVILGSILAFLAALAAFIAYLLQ